MSDGAIEVHAGEVVASPPFLTGRIVEHADRANPDESLSLEAAMLIFEGTSANTRANRRSQWKKFVLWCGATRRNHEPGYVTVETVVEWILELWRRPGRRGRPTAPETVMASLKTIAMAHRLAKRPERDERGNRLTGYPSPTAHPHVHRAMKAYTKRWLKAGHRPDTAHALTRGELVKLVNTLDRRTPMGVTDAAMLCVGYDMGARRVELADLDIGDLEFHVEDWANATEDDYMLVTVAMSKTDQRGEGAEVVLFAHPVSSASTCPVRAAKKQIDQLAAAGFTSGPFLRVVRTGGKPRADGGPKTGVIVDQRILGTHVPYVVERCVGLAGMDPNLHIVPHSLRAGAATEAGAAGADASVINDHIRWSQNGTTGNRYARLGRRRRANPMRKAWASEEDPNVTPRGQ